MHFLIVYDTLQRRNDENTGVVCVFWYTVQQFFIRQYIYRKDNAFAIETTVGKTIAKPASLNNVILFRYNSKLHSLSPNPFVWSATIISTVEICYFRLINHIISISVDQSEFRVLQETCKSKIWGISTGRTSSTPLSPSPHSPAPTACYTG